MSLKDDAIELTVAAVATLAVLWYVQRKISGAAGAVGDALSSGWNIAQTPIIDPTLPGASVANDIAAAPSNTADALSFGALSGTTLPGAGVLDTLKSGPMGGLWGMLTGDGNTNVFGPAPSAGIDFGTGANDWTD